MATFSSLLSSFDAGPGKRGRQFEIFVKWFLKADPEWATQVDVVWLWDEYPDRWGRDCGIDLVFRHRNGETWAVQAKCYSPDVPITKADVDSFISESNRQEIDKLLLIATTDAIGPNARQVCDAQEKSVVRYMLSNFESADVEYPTSFADLHQVKPKAKPQPRDHQIEAITAVAANFQKADRGQLIMACGTGKTFTTLWIKEKLSANSVLVLLPSLGLLSQTLHEWTLAANHSFNVLCVCSDQTVGKRNIDEAIHAVADLAFPVTSDITEIRTFLNRNGAKVVFSTYQSSPLVAEAQADQSTPAFDLAVADEAHRCAGKVGGDFSTILNSDQIRATKRLFTTATPRTYSTSVKKVAEERGVEVVGMDDQAVFGKVLYSMPFGEAIKRELLTDYRVVIIGVDNPTIADWIQNRELLKTDSGIENDAESLAAQIGLLKAYKDYDLKRVISFHSRVSRAESFTTDIQQVAGWIGEKHQPSGVLKTDFVSGAMPTDKRRRKLAQLKALGADERGLLTNARCLSEGVDVPSLDGVAFIDPRSSQIDIIQAVGRAIRLSPNKTAGTIVLPVFIEDGSSPTASIEASNFKSIWEVLNALKAHDDALSAELDQLRTELGRKSGSKVDPDAFSKISIDLPASVDHSFGDSLRTYLVEQVTVAWNYMFGVLEAFVEREGNARVPNEYITPDGIRLGQWTAVQRRTRNSLMSGRKERLESLAGWSWDFRTDNWEEGFLHLEQFADRNGHARVNRDFDTEDGYHLGLWVANQRTRRSIIATERQLRLESLPGWSWDPNSDKWEIGLNYLMIFARTEGHTKIPQSYKAADGYPIGSWATTQRATINTISPDRKARLEALPGWAWDAVAEKWEAGFQTLQEYVGANGHCLVPAQHRTANGYRLGQWVSVQRLNKGAMSTERRARLETLPNWSWDPHSEAWEKGFRYLQEFSEINEHCLVPALYRASDGYRIGSWVNTQRNTKDKMSVERKERLEALPGWVWQAKREG